MSDSQYVVAVAGRVYGPTDYDTAIKFMKELSGSVMYPLRPIE